MQSELVSVIMPAYNSEKYVVDSIHSVLVQTYEIWELIVVDDGSTDDTKVVVQQFSDDRIVYVYQQNAGVAVARNNGISRARGRYIAFLDSDDLWLPNKLSKQLAFMRENNYAFTYTWYQQFYSDENRVNRLVIAKASVDYCNLLKGNDIGCLTVMIDRSLIRRVFMPSCRHEDYVTWLNILKKGHKAYSLPEDLARYRKTDKSLTSNKFKSLLWTWQVYRNTQGLSFGRSLYYLAYYVIQGIKKHH